MFPSLWTPLLSRFRQRVAADLSGVAGRPGPGSRRAPGRRRFLRASSLTQARQDVAAVALDEGALVGARRVEEDLVEAQLEVRPDERDVPLWIAGDAACALDRV